MNFSAASTKGTAENLNPIYQRKKTFKEVICHDKSFIIRSTCSLYRSSVPCICKREQTKHRYKTTLALNGVMFFGLMLFTGVMMFSATHLQQRLLKLQQLRKQHSNRSWLYCSRTFHRHVLYRRWYRRSECSKRSTWCNQRRFLYPR